VIQHDLEMIGKVKCMTRFLPVSEESYNSTENGT
jgi:hypothetical protein